MSMRDPCGGNSEAQRQLGSQNLFMTEALRGSEIDGVLYFAIFQR